MSKRIHSVDSLRGLAILFVVIAHAKPFQGYGAYGNHVFFVLDTIGMFDVPFFFAASGYFLADKLNPGAVASYLRGSLGKLWSMYAFGILLYLPVLALQAATVALFRNRDVTAAIVSRLLDGLTPAGLLYYGDSIGFHLWFLTALIFAICFVSLFVVAGKTRYLLPVAAAAHVVGLIGESYPMLAELPFPTRDALFFGFFYVALGYHLRSTDWTPNPDRSRLYAGAFGALLLVQIAEQYAANYLLRGLALSQGVHGTNYTVSTVFLVLALFATALANPDWGEGTILPTIGEYAVGVYLAHVPVIHTIETANAVLRATAGVDLSTTMLWQLGLTPLVYVLSLGVYLLAARAGVIDIGGSHLPRLARIRARLGTFPSDANSPSD